MLSRSRSEHCAYRQVCGQKDEISPCVWLSRQFVASFTLLLKRCVTRPLLDEFSSGTAQELGEEETHLPVFDGAPFLRGEDNPTDHMETKSLNPAKRTISRLKAMTENRCEMQVYHLGEYI